MKLRRWDFKSDLAVTVLVGLAVLMTCQACAFATGHIPATSTPARTARYYRTQDAANLAAGVAVDELARLVFRGPRQCAETTWTAWGSHAIGSTCRNWAPVARIATVVLAGGLYRARSKDYRESGWLFNVGGAVSWEIVRCFFSSGCTAPRR